MIPHPRTWSPLTIGIVTLLAFAAFFGGASRLHELRLALVELAALPLLLIALSRLARGGEGPSTLALAVLAAAVALPLLQLVPLPPGLWTSLPGRDQAALAVQLADISTPWAPISLTPDKTWGSFLALLPPVATFAGVVLCRGRLQVRLVYGLFAFASLSVVLAAAQIASDGDGWYLWPTTSSGTVVGFFANRNHFATLCLLTLPFAAVLGGGVLRGDHSARLKLWLAILFIATMILALGAIRSRMGIILLGPSLAASLLAAWVASGGGRPKPLLLGLVGGAAIAAGIVSVFALAPLLARFDTAGVREGRFENWPVVAEAANAYLPLGSGLGSFDAVYRSVEPLERLDSTFFNQAHNEYLEIWLETGWIGAALIVVLLAWFGRRTWTAWRARPGRERDLQRAASVAIGVVLLHSAVDYPLRTETIAVIFAMMCALLDMAARSDDSLDEDDSRLSRRRRRSA